ncbi:DUF2393 family protein [Helicobacter sp. T3_23-1056]
MYPPLSFAPLKAMLVAIAEHITVVELGVFMLLFLVFVFFFFLSLVFWHFRRILFVFFLIETAILLCIPYGISQISQKIIYPIEVRYDKFRPFVYTTGFNYDIEITSKAKLPIKECLLTVIPKRAGANIIKKPRHSVESSEIEPNQIESNTKSNVESSTKTGTDSNAKSNIAMDSTKQGEAESSQANTTQEMVDSSTKQDSTKTTQESLSQSKIAQNTQISQTKQENNDDSKTPQQTQESKESANAEMQAQESKESQENKKPKKPKTPKPPSPYALKAYKILDYLAPIDAFVEVLTLDTPLTYNKKVRWQGIIRDYKYDENYGAQISCH